MGSKNTTIKIDVSQWMEALQNHKIDNPKHEAENKWPHQKWSTKQNSQPFISL